MKSTITFGGALIRVMLVALAVFVPAMALFSGPSPAPKAAPRSAASERHCLPVGGTVMTNFGAIDLNTTMGIATGDLRGAVRGNVLGPPQVVSGRVGVHCIDDCGT